MTAPNALDNSAVVVTPICTADRNRFGLATSDAMRFPRLLPDDTWLQQMTVNTDASLIQATSTVLTQVVDQRRIEDLPLDGRNILDLVAINAGVSDVGAVGSTSQIQNLAVNRPVSINGARGDGRRIDGAGQGRRRGIDALKNGRDLRPVTRQSWRRSIGG